MYATWCVHIVTPIVIIRVVFGCVFCRPNIIVLGVRKPKRKREKEVGRGGQSSSQIPTRYLSSAPVFSGASKTCMYGVKPLIVFWLPDHFVLSFFFPLSSNFFSILFFCFCFCLVILAAFGTPLLMFLFSTTLHPLACRIAHHYSSFEFCSFLLDILLLEVIVFLIQCCCIFSCLKLLFF